MALMVNGIGGGGGGDLPFSTRQIAMANISGVTGSGTVARMGNLVHIVVKVVVARNSSIDANTAVATIPEGFRPIQGMPLELGGTSAMGTGQSYVYLQADGLLKSGQFGSTSYATGFELSQFYMTAETTESEAYDTDDGGIMTWEDITPLINWQTGKAFILDSSSNNDRHLNFLNGGSTEGVRYTTINVLPGEFYRVSGWYVASEINPTGGNGKVNYGVVAGFLNSNNYLIDYKVANSSGDHTFLPNWEFRTTEFRVPPSATKLVIMNYNQAILSYVLRDASTHERIENTEIVHPLTDTIIERASTSSLSGSAIGQRTEVADIQLLTVSNVTWASSGNQCKVIKTGKIVQMYMDYTATISSQVSGSTNIARIPDGFRPPEKIRIFGVFDSSASATAGATQSINIDEDGYVSGVVLPSGQIHRVHSGFYICA